MERGKLARQVVEVSPPLTGEEGTPAQGSQKLIAYNRNNEGKDDLMVSKTQTAPTV